MYAGNYPAQYYQPQYQPSMNSFEVSQPVIYQQPIYRQQTKQSGYSEKNLGRILILLVACLGDEISDIVYLVNNWNSFASESLKIASIFFVVFPLALNYLMSFYLLSISYGCKNIGPTGLIAMLCCCWWVPLTGLLTFLLWTKILDLLDYLGITKNMFDEKDKNLKDLIKYSSYFELFVQDIPQVIIQSISNQMTQGWGLVEYVSLGFSIGMIIVGLSLFLFCPDKKKVQNY